MRRDVAVEEGRISFAAYRVAAGCVMKAGDDVGEFAEAALGSGAGLNVPFAAAGSLDPARRFTGWPDGEQGRVVESLYEVARFYQAALVGKGKYLWLIE